MDVSLLALLRDLPQDTVIYAIVLAVIIAPWIVRWRLRVRRIMIRLAWIGLGVVIGMNL